MAGPKINLTKVVDKKLVAARKKDKQHEADHKWSNDMSAAGDKTLGKEATSAYRNTTSKDRDKRKREIELLQSLGKIKGK